MVSTSIAFGILCCFRADIRSELIVSNPYNNYKNINTSLKLFTDNPNGEREEGKMLFEKLNGK